MNAPQPKKKASSAESVGDSSVDKQVNKRRKDTPRKLLSALHRIMMH